ncbi:MAG: stage 0 sporulation protein J [Chloroflexi bacterium RBG_16_54_18]|nr:MAG: stage 0 sporulation protein J [Chloroflexi bacterium RBG_16_54_18]
MTRKSGLGRGLEALIPGAGFPGEQGILEVPLDQISPNPRQPRVRLDPQKMTELADSIREHGIIQPLIVTEGSVPGEYILIAGERRLLAARQAGLVEIPVVVREATDQERLELALIENVQRADLNPLEMAEAYRQLGDEFGFTHEQIAERVAKSRVAVTNTLRLLKLPGKVKQALAEERISEGHARALLALPTPESQEAVLENIIRKDFTVRQTEDLVSKILGLKSPRPGTPPPNPEVIFLEKRLEQTLGTKVNLHKHARGGTLTIHYYSDEELNSLIDRLLGSL